MKFRLLYPVLLATAVVAIPSCEDDTAKPQPAGQAKTEQTVQPEQTTAPEQTTEPGQTAEQTEPGQVTEQETTEQQDTTTDPEPPAPEEPQLPTTEQVADAVAPLFADFPQLQVEETTMATEGQEDGSLKVTATTKLCAKADMVRTRALADVMDELRKGINETANKAMQPDSLYLLQIGAPATDISENQRSAKLLPQNLQEMANELKELSDVQVGIIQYTAGAEVATVTTTMKAIKDGDTWKFEDIQLNREPLEGISDTAPADELTEGTKLLPATFEQEMQQKVEAFNEAARAYILTREETARAIYTEKQALVEETLRKSEEAAAARAENEKICTNLLQQGKRYSGEWKRKKRFGTIAIYIRRAVRFDDSIQFVGELYDPDLPAASMDISGRCEFTAVEDGLMKVDVEIFDGKYDPNKPTAEVFDSSDSVLRLTLSKDGKMKGVMTCASWGTDSDKAFSISLLPADEVKEDKSAAEEE